MKNLFVFMIAMLFSISVFAQFGTDTKRLIYEFYRFPDFAVAKENRTYYVSVNVVKQVAGNCSADMIYDQINISGWNKIDNEDEAFLKVYVDIENLSIDETDVAVKEETVKSGETTKVVKHYFGKIIYDMPISIVMESPLNNDKMVREESKKLEWLTDEKKSYADAKAYVKDNMDALKDKIMKAEVQDLINYAIERLEGKYTFIPKSEFVKIEYLDSKKCEFYDEQQKLATGLKGIFNYIKADSDIEKVAADIQTYIDQYEVIIGKLNEADKKQKKAKVALMESVANLYYASENYAKASEKAEILLKQYECKDMGKLLGSIEKIQKDLAKHNLKYRHFDL